MDYFGRDFGTSLDAHGTTFMAGKLWWGVCVSARVEFCVCIVLFVVLGG